MPIYNPVYNQRKVSIYKLHLPQNNSIPDRAFLQLSTYVRVTWLPHRRNLALKRHCYDNNRRIPAIHIYQQHTYPSYYSNPHVPPTTTNSIKYCRQYLHRNRLSSATTSIRVATMSSSSFLQKMRKAQLEELASDLDLRCATPGCAGAVARAQNIFIIQLL